MACGWSQSWRFVLTALLATHFLYAQQKTNWDDDVRNGFQAFAAGRYGQAVESLTAALQDAEGFPALDLRRSDVAHLLAMSYQFQGKFDRAEGFYLQARSIREANGEAGRKVLGITLDAMAQLRFEQERWKEAEKLAQQAFALCRETRGEYDACTLNAQRHIGEIYSTEGRQEEAEAVFQQVIQGARQNPAPGTEILPAALRDQALILTAKGQYGPAEPLLKEALDLCSKLGDDRPDVADGLVALARLYRAERDDARAEPLLLRAAAIYENNNDPCLAHALEELGLIAITEGKYAIARERLLRTIAIYQKFLSPDHVNVAFAEVGLAEASLGERNYKEAQSMIEHALEIESSRLNDSHPELARAHLTAARINEARHRGREASADYRQALEIYRRATTRNNPARVMAEQQYERFSKSFRK